MGKKARLTIIGTGNIGRAMACGFAAAGHFQPSEMILTRRNVATLADLAGQGFQTQTDNRDAVRRAENILVAVHPAIIAESGFYEPGSEGRSVGRPV